ncbi:MAG: hypothetical protein K8I02_12085, partial [Candidatus Methylomirabilis sp.]|nr:hypothetical protein [Deltaproteobacteria bacterium]
MRRSARALAVLGPASLLAASCLSGGSSSGGLPSVGDASAGTGPQVVFDVFAESVPDVPFPNDIATRVDFDSPTGVRVNASLLGPTQLERDVRENFDRLDGWGTIGPITAQFTERLDIRNIRERHKDTDFSDDAVYLVNIDPASPKFGEPVLLDMGRGNYPLRLQKSAQSQFFQLDPRAGTSNVIFNVVAEDRNGNGALDPGEDTDFNGELDEPNILYDEATGELCSAATEDSPACDPDRRLVEFYEFKTNTLIMRPVVPLEQESRYAVVLTKRLVGYDGEPVRSPFRTINHTRQTEPLSVLPRALAPLGVGMDEVAFAWSFTTQSVTRDLEAIARGIRGEGAFSWLAAEHPAVFSTLADFGNPEALGGPTASPYVITQDQLAGIFLIVSFIQFSAFGIFDFLELLSAVDALNKSYEHVAYIVAGTYDAPSFVGSPDEIFHIDRRTGAAETSPGEVTFFITIPKETELCRPPFRTMFYGHGYSVSKLEALGFAGNFAKHCLATIGMDAPGHGPEIAMDQLYLDPRLALSLPLDRTLEEQLQAALGPLLPPIKQVLADISFNVIPVDRGFASPEEFAALSLDDMFEVVTRTPFFEGILHSGRGEDLDGDGFVNSGHKFWTANLFRTRDVVRQGIIDHVQMIAIMRRFDGATVWDFDVNRNGLRDDLAGDFDGDGRVDVGGPDAPYYSMGQSLGAFFSAILPAVEPAATAAVPQLSSRSKFSRTSRSSCVG